MISFRTYFLLVVIYLTSGAMPLKAQEIPDYLRDQIIEIQNQMLIEGFEVTSIGRTWLGRILIKASKEIGEVLKI